jgi:single-strand DNA-binding protein
MSGYLNRVSLIGNLGADPEVRSTQSGQKIVTMSIATSERWKDQRSGETRERTEWHRVVIFNEGLATIAERYLQKGAKVLVEGKLSTRKWQDQQGNDRYSTEIVLSPYQGILTFLESRRNGSANGGDSTGGTPPAGDPATGFDDSEIPF